MSIELGCEGLCLLKCGSPEKKFGKHCIKGTFKSYVHSTKTEQQSCLTNNNYTSISHVKVIDQHQKMSCLFD